jgi:hypothetical protein
MAIFRDHAVDVRHGPSEHRAGLHVGDSRSRLSHGSTPFPEKKVPATKSGEPGQSRCANYPDLVAGTFSFSSRIRKSERTTLRVGVGVIIDHRTREHLDGFRQLQNGFPSIALWLAGEVVEAEFIETRVRF